MKPLPAICLALITGCAGPTLQPGPVPEPEPESVAWPAPVGEVTLKRLPQPRESAALDVTLTLFDPGLGEPPSASEADGVFPEIRRSEARYLPVLLRQVLIESGAWGVVRVVPERDVSAELQLQARILHSDGQRLALAVDARDATGRVWLDRIYTDTAQESDYPVAEGDDPFADLYRQIANDLLDERERLAVADLETIRQVGVLRYAASLSPEAFGGFLEADASGAYRLLRLPAQDDPMVQRVQRIRNKEHLFIDTVDEQYVDLLESMRPSYNLWRQYGLEQTLYIEDYYQRLSERERAGRRGSFAAMQQAYNAFRWSKIQQQDLQELALGFDNEVTPTVLEVSGRVFRLSGSLQSQYDEWRAILRQVFALETGLPQAGTVR